MKKRERQVRSMAHSGRPHWDGANHDHVNQKIALEIPNNLIKMLCNCRTYLVYDDIYELAG
jgi:hypothetical protein